MCSQAGKVDSLISLVEEFLSAKAEDRKQVLQKLEEESGSLKGVAARFVFSCNIFWFSNVSHELLVNNKCFNLHCFLLLTKIWHTNLNSVFMASWISLLFLLYASYGKLYVKAANKVLEKGEEYAKKEVERLERLLSGVSVFPYDIF